MQKHRYSGSLPPAADLRLALSVLILLVFTGAKLPDAVADWSTVCLHDLDMYHWASWLQDSVVAFGM